MKVWILGAGGQLGGALVDRCEVLGISFLASKREEADITDLELLKRKAEKSHCTHIINCAAYTDVDGAERESQRAFAINATGSENVGIVARENGMRLVHVSTDYVFDGEKDVPYHEKDRPNPLGVYGKSKWEGEERVLEQLSSACIVRTSWIFGHEGKNFISSLLSKLQEQDHIQAVHDQMNRATYNRDLAGALVDLSCHSGIFHFANEGAISRYKIAKDFFQEAASRGIPLKCQKISPVSMNAFPNVSPRPIYSVLDTKKVSLALGRKPRMWETILKEYFDHVSSLH
ncbi:MAG: dTDP-4-dehydrorhamnose reductase [Chlamydiae bacterium]|nr:dTDP-4-dehydrorhamnose reductase [Chlamydiota bacterium]